MRGETYIIAQVCLPITAGQTSDIVPLDDDDSMKREDLAIDKGKVRVTKALRPERRHQYIAEWDDEIDAEV